MSFYSDAYGTRNAVASLTTAARVISARADVAYAFASLVRTHAKGNLGEAYAQRYFIRNKLGEAVSGKWTSLTPRTGRQGFDHLFVRRRGNKFLGMVCESKYDKSTLGVLKDGTQVESIDGKVIKADQFDVLYETINRMQKEGTSGSAGTEAKVSSEC